MSAVDGNDGNDGRSAAKAWKTLARVNAASEIAPGDGVFFSRGQQFAGTLVPRSGTAGKPVLYSAYGAGAKPVLTGFATLANWTALGDGSWESLCAACGTKVNMVTINAAVQRMGRYPNSGYLGVRSHVGRSSITGADAQANWAGGEVVIKKNQWVIDRALVTSVSGATIAYDSPSTYDAKDKFGFFFQNHPATLDQFGEWYFNPTTKKLRVFFGAGVNPSAYTVKAAALNTIVNANDRSFVTLDNLALQGSQVSTVTIGNTDAVKIVNSELAYAGTDAITGTRVGGFTLEGSSISQTLNNGVDLVNATKLAIKGNTLADTGMIPGMGRSGDGTYSAITLNQVEASVQFNQVLRSGYNGIAFFYPQGAGVAISNNHVDGCTLVKSDGGCVYSWHSFGDRAPNLAPKLISGNVLLRATGTMEGIDPAAKPTAVGIYLDDGVSNGQIIGNTVAHATHSGIFVHNAHEWQIRNNTLFDNGAQIETSQGSTTGVDVIRNLEVTGNILAGRTDKQLLINAMTMTGDADIAAMGRFGANRYARTAGDPLVIRTEGPNGQAYALSGWQSKFGFDLDSTPSPVNRPAYVLNSLLSANKVSNGDFSLNLDGIWPYNGLANAELTRQSGKLDGPALQIAFPRPSGTVQATIVFTNIGAVSSGRNYLVRFSALALRSKTVGVYLRQSNSPWHPVTPVQYTQVGTSRTEAQLVFTAPVSQDVALVLELPDEETLWVDNLAVHEASVSPLNVDAYVRFDYNATGSPRSLRLDRLDYVDAAGNPVLDLTLAPYSSAVSFRR